MATFDSSIATPGYAIVNVENTTDYVWIVAEKVGTADAYVFQYDKATKAFTSGASPVVLKTGTIINSFCVNSAVTLLWGPDYYNNQISVMNLSTYVVTSYGFTNANFSDSPGLQYIVTDSTNIYCTCWAKDLMIWTPCTTIGNIQGNEITLLSGGNNRYVIFYDDVNTCVWIVASLIAPTSSSTITVFKYIPGASTATTVKTFTSGNEVTTMSSDGTYLWIGTLGTLYQMAISGYTISNTYVNSSANWRGIYADGTGGSSDLSSGYTYATVLDSPDGVLVIKASTFSEEQDLNYTASTITGDSEYIYFGNGAAGFIVFKKNTPICYNENTKILSLVNGKRLYVPIQDLRKGDLIKTFLHGYKKVDVIGKGSFTNNVNKPDTCMYKLVKSEQNTLIEDLIVTGKHSLLVDHVPTSILDDHFDGKLENVQKVDDKYLIHASINPAFEKMEDSNEYTYYHLVLENDDNSETKRYGIWANGVLSETTFSKDFEGSKLKVME